MSVRSCRVVVNRAIRRKGVKANVWKNVIISFLILSHSPIQCCVPNCVVFLECVGMNVYVYMPRV